MSKKDILLQTGTNEFEIIEFFIEEATPEGSEREYYGINVAKVLEVVDAPKGLAPSDSAPHPSFLGTMPLRDLILPVVDLSIWLEVQREKQPDEVILVTEFTGRSTGFLVTGVTQIHRVNWQEVEPPNRYLSEMETNCITGTVLVEDRFILLLDLEKIIAELDPEYIREMDKSQGDSGAGYSALVVDDSTSMRMMLVNKLSEAGFELQTASNGVEAWNYLEALLEQVDAGQASLPDVVVADVEMPQMDGYSLTKRIKDHHALKGIPVVLFSSLVSDKIRHKGDSVGADDQVTKPEFNQLAARCAKLIEEKRLGETV